MYENHSVAVVVPAYNEVEFVGDVIDEIPGFVDTIYAVDDRSTDGTWEVIKDRAPEETAASATDPERAAVDLTTDGGRRPIDSQDDDRNGPPALDVVAQTVGYGSVPLTDGGTTGTGRVVGVRHRENQGAGGALRTGYQFAHADGADVTVAMDADGQMDPDQMTDLLDPIVEGEAEYAKGNRLADADYRAAMPRFRLFGNWVLTMLTKVASGFWKTMDPQNGYTAISHEALSAIDVESMASGHDYTNDLLVRLNVAGMRVADVAMPAVYGDEQSTIDYASFVPKTSTTLLRSFCWRLQRTYLTRDFHPLAFLYGLGSLSALGGLLWGADGLRRDGTEGSVRVVGGLVSFLVGCLFLLLAMAFDVGRNEDREVRRE